jgi:hypothetical protein
MMIIYDENIIINPKAKNKPMYLILGISNINEMIISAAGIKTATQLAYALKSGDCPS